MKNKFIFGLGLVLLVVTLLVPYISSYQESNPSYSSTMGKSGFFSFTGEPEKRCEMGQDFIVQVSPFGCIPTVVRSDLLEEQDVPVFCQLVTTKINPLVDIEAIDDITFTGTRPQEVRDIAFMPSRVALGYEPDKLGSPTVLDNVGYAVIVLKRQANSSSMPDYVDGTITAKLRYDLKNAFGVGRQSFYLPQMSDSDWDQKYLQYSFWDGKGYLRADEVYDDGAQMTLYNDVKKLQTFNLKVGDTSNKYYIPGYDCLAGLSVKLDSLEPAANTRVRLNVNGPVFELKEGETFLDGRCKVSDIYAGGLVQSVNIKCPGENFKLSIAPTIKLQITNGDIVEEFNASIGDKLPYKIGDGDEKSVYLGYIGKDDRGIPFIVPVVSTAKNSEEFLSTQIYKQLPMFARGISSDAGNPFFNLFKDVFVSATGGLSVGLNYFITGSYPVGWIYLEEKGKKNFNIGKIEKPTGIFDISWNYIYEGLFEGVSFFDIIVNSQIKFLGFAGPIDQDLSSKDAINVVEYYEKAIDDYNYVISDFSNTKYNENNPLNKGEEAFRNKIKLTYNIGLKRSVLEMCKEFKEKYPNSGFLGEMKNYCDDEIKLSSSAVAAKHIVVNGEVKEIYFEGVFEPDFEEYGALVTISSLAKDQEGKNRFETLVNRKLFKGAKIPLLDGDSVELVSVQDDYITVKFNVDETGWEEAKKTVRFSGTDTRIKLDGLVSDVGVNQYKVKVNKINLKKLARVSIIPSIDYAGTEANFSFKIGIEKRGIQLAPDQIEKKINTLNASIKDWEDKSSKLGKVVKVLKGACFGFNAFLTVKNFLANTKGKAIARQEVMRGEGGWYQKCEEYVRDKTYTSIEKCLSDKSSDIEKDVTLYYDKLEEQNKEIKDLEKLNIKDTAFGTKIVDDVKFSNDYWSQNKEKVRSNLIKRYGNQVKIGNDEININSFIDNIKTEQVSIIDIRELVLNSEISGTETLDNIADKTLQMTIKRIYENTRDIGDISSLSTEFREKGIEGADISWDVVEDSIKRGYSGWVYEGKKIIGAEGYFKDSNKDPNKRYPVRLQGYGSYKYLFILDSGDGTDYGVTKAFKYEGIDESQNILVSPLTLSEEMAISRKFSYVKYDKGSYYNPYTSSLGSSKPLLRYYETEPYKGLPAIVPFDLEKGWYVSIKQTLPVGGKIASYDESGRVNSFYLCNVGSGGKEENRGGNDICQMINLGTGQPYNQFYGMSSTEAKKLVDNAVSAVEQASKQYKSGVKMVVINGKNIEVGSPAADVSDMQCQDFMSPADCKLLFNVCDPVICPSSRCDLGGAYPVRDVVQSGIFGSLALCLPNFPQVYVPICLTGVKAGIDGWLSVQKSYRDCLATSLETGETVGICDELHSVYMCELIWRQGLPLAKLVGPKIIENILGQNTRGGGEYLGVQSAWDNAEGSMQYFTQYYSESSSAAFKARTAEEVGGEVCKAYVSTVFPTSSTMLDVMTEPDSPPQYHGRFDEIPYTTATNPPISHYKVFYHIYAGNDQGVYYKVYLKGNSGSSYYQDTSSSVVVNSNYIPKGQYASETKDFTAPSGYQQLCIMVNSQEECGFKQVSTEFALNYIQDKYLEQQASQKDIKKESECVSGTSSLYSLANPNLQDGAEEAINPELYNYGIVRICANYNPGKGTDENADGEESRWVDVGYCDDKKIRCWLDQKSVKDTIKNANIEGNVLDEQASNFQENMLATGNYIRDDAEFEDELKKLADSGDDVVKMVSNIDLIDDMIPRAFFNNHKAHLYFLRGIEYGKLAIHEKGIFDALHPPEGGEPEETPKGIPEESAPAEKTPAIIEFGEGETENNKIIILEFADGTAEDNIYYSYFNNMWRFSIDKKLWIDIPIISLYLEQFPVGDQVISTRANIPDFMSVFSSLSKKNQDFILSLEKDDKSTIDFEEGLLKLIERTEENKEGGILDASLVVNNIEFVSEGYFKVKGLKSFSGEIYLSYNFDAKVWRWSIDSERWNVVDLDKVTTGNPWIIDNSELFKAVAGKDFMSGMISLFRYETELTFLETDKQKIIQDYGEGVLDDVQDELFCEDCGTDKSWYTFGLGNICYEDECKAISIKTKKVCIYEDTFGLGGRCKEKLASSCKTIASGVQLSVYYSECISVDEINTLLRNSPASGTGGVFIKYGKIYNIDPLIALAFFWHESNFGTKGLAVKTMSVGNIRYSSKCPGTNYNGFCKYTSWEDSIQDWYRLISGSLYVKIGLDTVEKIVPKYAPSTENDVNAYIDSVRTFVATNS